MSKSHISGIHLAGCTPMIICKPHRSHFKPHREADNNFKTDNILCKCSKLLHASRAPPHLPRVFSLFDLWSPISLHAWSALLNSFSSMGLLESRDECRGGSGHTPWLHSHMCGISKWLCPEEFCLSAGLFFHYFVSLHQSLYQFLLPQSPSRSVTAAASTTRVHFPPLNTYWLPGSASDVSLWEISIWH